MSRGLLDFVKDNPYTEEELFEQAETEEEKLFRQIREGIEYGGIARNVLKDCLSLIGKLSKNQAWADDLKGKLDKTEKPVRDIDIPL